MYGLCLINSHFTSDGSGRDFTIMSDPERRIGKVGRPGPLVCHQCKCHPRKRPNGPRPPSLERVKQLNQGLWQCSGQWTSEAKSSKALPVRDDRGGKLRRSASDTLAKVGSYDNSMQAWTDGRLPDLKRYPNRHHGWVRCHSQSQDSKVVDSPRSAASEPGVSLKMSQSLCSTYQSMNSNHTEGASPLQPRKGHGYMEPGILRRDFSRQPAGFTANVDRVQREDRFIRDRQPHEIEVSRSTMRESRFIPPTFDAVT